MPASTTPITGTVAGISRLCTRSHRPQLRSHSQSYWHSSVASFSSLDRQSQSQPVRSRISNITRTTPLLGRTRSLAGSFCSPFSTSSSTPDASTPMAAEADTLAPASGITPESLRESLLTAESLKPSHVDIQDISGGCGSSFAAVIVSASFQGKTALARHRLVNAVLKEEIKAIHAWTPKCLTPEQWEKERQRE